MKINKLILTILPLILTSCGGSSTSSVVPSSSEVDPYIISEEYYNENLKNYGLVNLEARFRLNGTVTNETTGDIATLSFEGDKGNYHSVSKMSEMAKTDMYFAIKAEDYVPEHEGYLYRSILFDNGQYIENDFRFNGSPYVDFTTLFSNCGFLFATLDFSSLTYNPNTHAYHKDEHLDPKMGLLTNIDIYFENGELKNFALSYKLASLAINYVKDDSVSVTLPTPDRIVTSGNALFSKINNEVNHKEEYIEALNDAYFYFRENGTFIFYCYKAVKEATYEVFGQETIITGNYEFQLDDFVIIYNQVQVDGENIHPLGYSEVHRGKMSRKGEITFTTTYFSLQDSLNVCFILTNQ